jgi:hypothetical protein
MHDAYGGVFVYFSIFRLIATQATAISNPSKIHGKAEAKKACIGFTPV